MTSTPRAALTSISTGFPGHHLATYTLKMPLALPLYWKRKQRMAHNIALIAPWAGSGQLPDAFPFASRWRKRPLAQIRDRGMAMMTGCGHGGVLNLLDCTRDTFQGGDRIFALYGGLHISPL